MINHKYITGSQKIFLLNFGQKIHVTGKLKVCLILKNFLTEISGPKNNIKFVLWCCVLTYNDVKTHIFECSTNVIAKKKMIRNKLVLNVFRIWFAYKNKTRLDVRS